MVTIKQETAAKKLMENHGNVSKAMLDAGYDPTTAKNPKNLTESKGFQELMGEAFPFRKLKKKHNELLNAAHLRTMIFEEEAEDEDIRKYLQLIQGVKVVSITLKKIEKYNKKTKTTSENRWKEVRYVSPDRKTQISSLDMMYKILGHYAPIKQEIDDNRENKEKIDKISEIIGALQDEAKTP